MPDLTGIRERIRALNQPAPMHEFADYDAYWEERKTVGDTMVRWKVAADFIEDGASVLDVGCGSGEFLEYLVTRRPAVRALGCDLSEEAVSLTEAKGFADSFVLDLSEEDIPGRYDYVTCLEVIEHIANAEDALQRLARAFRKRLIISVPNVGYLDNRLRLLLHGRFPITNCHFHIKEHVRHWGAQDFCEWVEAFDLRVVKVASAFRAGRLLPVERHPGLLSPGLVYEIEHAPGRQLGGEG